MNYLQRKKQAMISMHRSFIPSGYKQVEYLESTGEQYINPNLFVDSSYNIELDFAVTYISNFNPLFGGREKWLRNAFAFALPVGSSVSANKFRLDFNNTYYSFPITPTVNTKYKFRYKNYIASINDFSHTFQNSAFKYNIPFILFGFYGENRIYCGKNRIYNFKLLNKTENIMELLPCLDNNNRPCMYDTVSKKTYYNQGTGEFLYGEVIN